MSLSDEKKKHLIKKKIDLVFNDDSLTEEEHNSLLFDVKNISPDPKIIDYIFQKKYDHLTIDEAIEKAFSYQPICLGDQSNQD